MRMASEIGYRIFLCIAVTAFPQLMLCGVRQLRLGLISITSGSTWNPEVQNVMHHLQPPINLETPALGSRTSNGEDRSTVMNHAVSLWIVIRRQSPRRPSVLKNTLSRIKELSLSCTQSAMPVQFYSDIVGDRFRYAGEFTFSGSDLSRSVERPNGRHSAFRRNALPSYAPTKTSVL